tara:strand:- start:157 stop:453 length:297 start_codon:yes stop_codon:yes gene_type:complete
MPADEIMSKFKRGTLKSGSGKKVTDREQAKAIAASYAAGGLISPSMFRKVMAENTNLADLSNMRAKGMIGTGSKTPKLAIGGVVNYKDAVRKKHGSSE